jgi:hypothetical protein
MYLYLTIRFEAAKGEQFEAKAKDFSEVAMVTIGDGNDKFPDSWASFECVDGKNFAVFVQSKKTITSRSFNTKDLKQQLRYLAGISCSWILFVITDGNS